MARDDRGRIDRRMARLPRGAAPPHAAPPGAGLPVRQQHVDGVPSMSNREPRTTAEIRGRDSRREVSSPARQDVVGGKVPAAPRAPRRVRGGWRWTSRRIAVVRGGRLGRPRAGRLGRTPGDPLPFASGDRAGTQHDQPLGPFGADEARGAGRPNGVYRRGDPRTIRTSAAPAALEPEPMTLRQRRPRGQRPNARSDQRRRMGRDGGCGTVTGTHRRSLSVASEESVKPASGPRLHRSWRQRRRPRKAHADVGRRPRLDFAAGAAGSMASRGCTPRRRSGSSTSPTSSTPWSGWDVAGRPPNRRTPPLTLLADLKTLETRGRPAGSPALGPAASSDLDILVFGQRPVSRSSGPRMPSRSMRTSIRPRPPSGSRSRIARRSSGCS